MMNWEKIFSKQKRSIPRWAIFSFDLAICCTSLILAFILRFDFNVAEAMNYHGLSAALFIVLFFRIIAFLTTKTYAGIIRYTGSQDAVRIAVAVSSSSLAIFIVDISYYYFFQKNNLHIVIPTSVIIIDFFITVFLMTGVRLGYKILFREVKNASVRRTRVLIYGAGQLGMITKRTLDQDTGARFKVVGFLDNDPAKISKLLEGVKIYHGDEEFEKIISKGNIDQLIISIQDINSEKKKEIVETCLQYNVDVSIVPPIQKWINGELGINQIKHLRIEDLLGRDAIQIVNAKVSQQIRNKTILVTGAAGSIGSELARQIMKLYPEKVILLDQAETPLYELEYEFKKVIKFQNIDDAEFIIGDICNESFMRKIFKQFRPDKVFHAAAYKHVPLMELNPSQAVQNNILGTKITADLAIEYGVSRFVMVSTDKAVNPTSVMGASKRVAEIYVQSLNNYLENKNSDNHTLFITTRFGNVLGSNGSVIPLFRKQIEEGGPITVTHPDITRYFMTIPESCQLVLEAGCMGNGGEIYIFDMGEPVKIIDLAKKMIRLSGLIPEKDIKINFTGLRPGEKIFEELLNDKENTLPTHHPKIMIGNIRQYDFDIINDKINNLIITAATANDELIVQHIKNIIPEYKSNNSVFEILDKGKN